MTLLTICQNVAEDIGIPSPTTVVGNTDRQIVQLLQIAQREGRDLASRYGWTDLIKENTFTLSTSSQDQGLLNSAVVSDGDFDYVINDTMWNRTDTLPIPGSLSPRYWQTLQSFVVTAPYLRYRINQRKLFIEPTPPSADTVAFEYKSKFWCESSGGNGQAAWAADNDVGILDERLMELGVLWRWLKRKGLEYSQDFQTYETQVNDAIGRDGGKPRLNSSSSAAVNRMPGIAVPPGSWVP